MKKMDNMVIIGYRMVNGVLLAGTILMCPAGVNGIGTVKPEHLLCCVITVVILAFMQSVQGKMRLYGILALAAVLCLTAGITGAEQSIELITGYLKWLLGREGWLEKSVVLYEMLQVFFLTGISYGVLYFMEKYPAIKRISAVMVVGFLLLQLLQKKEISKGGMIFSFSYLLIVITEWVRYLKKGTEQKGRYREYMFWLAPFLGLYIILLCFCPAPEDAYQWQWVKDIYSSARQRLVIFWENFNTGNREDFGISTSGFSEGGKLLGELWNNDKPVMTIKCRKKPSTNIYLSGKVFEDFDGRSWSTKGESSEQDWLLDTMETVYAVEKYDKENTRDYLRDIRVDIGFRSFHSKYVFLPLKTSSVLQGQNIISYEPYEGGMIFDEQKGYGTEYGFRYFQLNLSHPAFEQFLQSRTKEDEEVWKDVVKRFDSESKDITLQALTDYRQRMEEQYLQETAISSETGEWLSAVTQGAETDWEKLKCIEKQLQSFTYTLDIGELPEKVTSEAEFLDYFLLESKEGYCSYFATAFVLLARAEGVPARYVLGFWVDAKNTEEIMVSSDMAHAWPEVYLEGIGWIPFEPTPGYEQIRNKSWSISAHDTPDYVDTSGSQYMEETETMEEIAEDTEDVTTEKEEKELVRFLLTIFVCFIIIMITGTAGIILTDSLRDKKRSSGERFQIAALRNLQILAALGYKRGENETLCELHKRAESHFQTEQYSPVRFLSEYEGFLYGGKEVTQEQWEIVERERQELFELLKKEKGKMYILYKVKIYLVRIQKP